MPQMSGVIRVVAIAIIFVPLVIAQQKGQWVPGQVGLNAGVLPDPGITYMNLTLNYSADRMMDRNGNTIPVTGSYGVWAVENWLSYVSNFKVLKGRYVGVVMLTAVNGSLTVPQFGVSAGGYGYGDTFIEPFALGWHFSRLDTYAAYGFLAPTGRYTPGANDNLGSGYWGNHFITGTTLYLAKNKGTTANLMTDWEIHGTKESAAAAKMTPGQAFTDEWGVGQVIPLDKQMKKLLQVGVIGYDQWQVSENSGFVSTGVPASLAPFYSVHAIGFQTNFMMPQQNLFFFFKYEPEYVARAHSQGTTLSFGGSWTLRIPKPKPHP